MSGAMMTINIANEQPNAEQQYAEQIRDIADEPTEVHQPLQREDAPDETRPAGWDKKSMTSGKGSSGNRSQSPGANKSDTPSGTSTRSAVAHRTQTPSENKSETPSGTSTRSPGAHRTRSPSGNKSKTPSGNMTQSPSANSSRSPSANRTRSPSANRTWSPSGNKSKTRSGKKSRHSKRSPTGSKSKPPTPIKLHVSSKKAKLPLEEQITLIRQNRIIAEFNKLKTRLHKETLKIVIPPIAPFTPHIGSTLAPYHDTSEAEYLLSLGHNLQYGYITRNTAVGVVAPEISQRMDVNVGEVPKSHVRGAPTAGSIRITRDITKKSGITFARNPPLQLTKHPDKRKRLDWSDVPDLREDLKEQTKVITKNRFKVDYNRTIEDWSRMSLGKLEDISDHNRAYMKLTCTHYMGTTPGAHKAMQSLTKDIE